MRQSRGLYLIFLILIAFYSNSVLSKPLTVGITEFYPPYVMRSANNTAYGFDVSLMNAVCAILKMQCQYKQLSFEGLLPAVRNGDVDFAISSIIITRHRLKTISFSIPYLKSNGRFVANSSATFTQITPDILETKRIGLQKEAAYVSYVKELKIKNTQIKYYDTRMDQINALIENKIDLIVIDNQAALYWIKRSQSGIKTIGQPFPIGEGLGIAVADKSKQYLPSINQAIYALYKQKVIKALYGQYFQ